MRHIIIYISLLANITVLAQSNEDLRRRLEQQAELVAYYPESVDMRLRKAALNLQLEQYEYAKVEYDYILERDTSNIAALYYRAFTNEKLARYSFARMDYENLLRIVPRHFNGQLGLSLLCFKTSKQTEALDRINALIEQCPDSAIAYAVRGGFEKEMGYISPAEYDYAEAMRLDPTNTDYLLNHCVLLIEMKRKREALEDIRKAISLGISPASLSDLTTRIKKLKQ